MYSQLVRFEGPPWRDIEISGPRSLFKGSVRGIQVEKVEVPEEIQKLMLEGLSLLKENFTVFLRGKIPNTFCKAFLRRDSMRLYLNELILTHFPLTDYPHLMKSTAFFPSLKVIAMSTVSPLTTGFGNLGLTRLRIMDCSQTLYLSSLILKKKVAEIGCLDHFAWESLENSDQLDKESEVAGKIIWSALFRRKTAVNNIEVKIMKSNKSLRDYVRFLSEKSKEDTQKK